MRPATETHLRPARSLPAILEHAKTCSTAGAGVVVALTPAHNEEDQIEQAIRLASYWARQLVTFFGVVVTAVYVASLAWSFFVVGTIRLQPLWLAVTAIFAVERVVTVRARGPLQMALAGSLVVGMSFDIFLQAIHGKAIWDTLRQRERTW